MKRKSPGKVAPQRASRIEARFRGLFALNVSIFSEHTTEALLQRIVDGAREVVGARYAALGVLAPNGASLATFVTSGIDPQLRADIGDLPHGRGLLGLVIREPRPIRTRDIAHHPDHCGFPSHHPVMHSFLGVPIKTERSVFGNLYFTEKIGAREFDAEDEGIAVLLANQAAVAIENARLMEESGRLLSQVQNMQRQRDLFFAMMNHELRNALTGVFGWAERLVRPRTPDAMAQAAKEVYEGAERTITGFEPAAEAKRLAFTVEVPANAGALRTDPVRLQQILVNLVSNAVRHAPEGGTVRLAVRHNGNTVEFLVQDDGAGIPQEALDRIFEPFERFDPHSGVGTGLGLPVSRRLAEVLGGRLTVQTAPGKGATFILELPRQPVA